MKKISYKILSLISLTTFAFVSYAEKKNQKTIIRIDKNKDKVVDRIILDEVSRSALPVSPEAEEKLKRVMQKAKKMKKRPRVIPEYMSRSILVDTTPGAPSPLIYLSPNYVTTLIFMDKNGKKWPLKNYILSNPQKFSISNLGDNILLLSPMSEYARANMVVSLQGKDIPVVFTLETVENKVDYRTEIRFNDDGPNTIKPLITLGGAKSSTPVPFQVSKELNNILDGSSNLKGFYRLETNNPDVEAWTKDDKRIFIRTKNILHSPAPLYKTRGYDGVNAYIINYANYILTFDNGELIETHIKDRKY